MKGPYERLKYDLRRVWECPVCHHRERTGGDVTFRLCGCQRKLELDQRVWMKLIQESGRRTDPLRPPPPTDVEAEIETSDDSELPVTPEPPGAESERDAFDGA